MHDLAVGMRIVIVSFSACADFSGFWFRIWTKIYMKKIGLAVEGRSIPAHQNFCRAHACAACFLPLSRTFFLRLTPLVIITCCALKPRHIFLSCNTCFIIIKTPNSPSTLSHLMRIYCEANFVFVKGRERQGSIQHVVRGHAATAGGWCIAPSRDECNASTGRLQES